MAERYNDILKVSIGKVLASALIDNYFPLVGESIRIDATTKWGQTSEWQIQNGGGQTVNSAGSLLHNRDSKEVDIVGPGELRQRFIGRNSLFSAAVQKTVYAMAAQGLPYFDVKADKEIVRTDSEVSRICIYPENGYTGAHTVVIRVYRENEESNPVATFTNVTQGEGYEYAEFFVSKPSDRGIYDVEVDVADTSTGTTFSKRINKLITVTPRLAPEPADRTAGYRDIPSTKCFTTYSGNQQRQFYIRLWENTGYGLSYAEMVVPAGQQDNLSSYYDSIDISVLPAGTTLVLLDDPEEPDPGYARRLSLKGNSPTSISNKNGTPNFTWEAPLVITFNRNTPYEIPFRNYSGISFDGNCRNIVLDGRGYKNIRKGLYIHRYSPKEFAETNVFLLNGTAEVELFELELCDNDFTGIMAKTDPDVNRPWYWFGNWEMNRLLIHHCHIHHTHGEGFYIGYFTPETKTGTNSAGEQVSYRAHALTNTRIYRLVMEHNGYDAMQLSNARDAEVCYNELYDCAWRGDKDQMSGISIQSISGKCYNNIIKGHNGPAIQVGPLGDVEVFNNIVSGGSEGTGFIQFLFSVDTPEQDPDGSHTENRMRILIHNNTVICNGVALNGRNTSQIMGVYTQDNFIVYKTVRFGNMAAGTIEQWEKQASGNVWIDSAVIDYGAVDGYGIADSENGIMHISADSPLIQGGEGDYFKFDFRGYKNWFPSTYPVGAYMGKYRTPNIEIISLTLNSLLLNGGASMTYLPDLNVRMNYTGGAKEYRIGLQPDLADASWQKMTPDITYTLNGTYGQHRVYAQVRNNTEISEIVSAEIEYIYMPTILTGISVNGGATSTIFDRITVDMAYDLQQPQYYMVSEDSTFADAQWQEYAGDSFSYTITGSSRIVTLYVKVKNDNVESEVRSASIAYTETVRYSDVTLRIPLSQLEGDVSGIQAVMPELKYNKRFAFSWTVDDSLIYVYSRIFNYVNKKWVDDSRVFHDGMVKTTGAVPSRFLCYTDGCGRDVRFGFNSGFISHLNGKTPTLEYTYNGSLYFHLEEMQKFIDFGNGVQNHGAGGYNAEGAVVAVRMCNEEVKSKLGFTPFLLLFPGEEDPEAFKSAGNDNPDIYQMSTLIKDTGISLSGLRDGFFSHKQSLMNRLTYDNYTLGQLKEKADYAYTQNNAYLMNVGGHNIEVGNSKFIDWETEVKPFLDYLYDTYGKGGNDSIWIAPLEEIYEYIFTRHFSTVNVGNDGTDLVISLRLAGMKNFRQGYEMTLQLSGVDFSNVKSITSENTLYYLASGVQADGTLLVNLNCNQGLPALAEKYVAAFEASPSQDTLEDAVYMISRLSDDLRLPYQERVDALNRPFGLNSILINNNADSTVKQEVKITIVFDGFTAPASYRLGESPDLSEVPWIDFISEVPFSLSSGLGVKTVYCQIKAPDGTVSEVRSDTIEVLEAGTRKAIVSLGWSKAEIPSSTEGYSVYDAATGITRFQSQAAITESRHIYDTLGELLGTAVPSTNSVTMISSAALKGAVTGDDSGVYPDEYLWHNSAMGANAVKNESITFTLPAGTYKVRIFTNTIWAQRVIPNEALSYKAVTDTDEKAFTLPTSGVQNNTANLTEPVTVTVGENGMLRIDFGVGKAGTYYYAPLNIIEIEEV